MDILLIQASTAGAGALAAGYADMGLRDIRNSWREFWLKKIRFENLLPCIELAVKLQQKNQ